MRWSPIWATTATRSTSKHRVIGDRPIKGGAVIGTFGGCVGNPGDGITSAADIQPRAGEHVVYFYDGARSLAAVAAERLGAALLDGGAAIVIATAAHRAAFAAELERLRFDVSSAERAGTLVFLDARRTLDQLLVDEAPDPGRFQEVIGAAIAGLARRVQGPLFAYGEMVGLLWDVGDVEAVIALEELWNDLLADVAFALLCGYPAAALDEGSTGSVARVCDTHSKVISWLPAPASSHAARAFGKSSQSPGRARGFVADVLRTWGAEDEFYDDAALIVTELAVNAIKHAQSGFTVSLDRLDAGIRVTVGDAARTPPVRLSTDVRDASGRGLLLVEAVSQSWGSSPAEGGKLVWAELRAADGRTRS